MKILAGELEPTAGNVSTDPNKRIGQLRQDHAAEFATDMTPTGLIDFHGSYDEYLVAQVSSENSRVA